MPEWTKYREEHKDKQKRRRFHDYVRAEDLTLKTSEDNFNRQTEKNI